MKKGGLCNTCKSKRYREKNPLRYAYNTLRSNSKRRGISFSLTFEEFKEFATETKYILGKGKSRDSLTIDRIDDSKGYEIENIQVLTNSENVRKMLRFRWCEYERRMIFKVETIGGVNQQGENNDVPF